MRISPLASGGALALLVATQALCQALPDPPALCNAPRTHWNSEKAGADPARLQALLRDTPNACETLRAEIARQLKSLPAPQAAATVKHPRPARRAGTAGKLRGPIAKPASAANAQLRPGQTFQDCRDCPSMIVVPGSTFLMGSDPGETGRFTDEGPQNLITIAPLAIGRFEVTFDEWDACVRDGGCGGYRPPDSGWGRGRRPVIFVSWSDATAYTRWLSSHTGHRYRLPSESEWEYAARAGSHGTYGFDGDVSKICKYGNIADRSSPYASTIACTDGYPYGTAPVGQFAPNAFGLYDTIGNVSEWVADCYHDNLSGVDRNGKPYRVADCATHIVRGSAWGLWRPESAYSEDRIAARFPVPDSVVHGGNGEGFRVARDLHP